MTSKVGSVLVRETNSTLAQLLQRAVYRHLRVAGPRDSNPRSRPSTRLYCGDLRPPSPLLDTLFALQEFVYKCALFAERAHLLFNCAVFPSCVNLSPLSVIVNYFT